jgi:ribonuclease Z
MEQKYWEKSYKIPNTPYTLIGYSIAAKNTGFYIPELKIALDIGVPSCHSPNFIFITHCHYDHCGCLPNCLFDIGSNSINIFAPKNSISYIKNYINSTFSMTKNTLNPKIHHKYKLNGVYPEEKIYLNIKNKDYIIDIIKSYHTVPCVSYGFNEVRTKLKDEYKLLSQNEIEHTKLEGIEITHKVEYPQFCFVGDTNEKIFSNEIIFKFPIIIIECSFLYDDHLQFAKKDHHMHWKYISDYINKYDNIIFILIHFSARYTSEDITNFFSDKLKNNLIVWNFIKN